MKKIITVFFLLSLAFIFLVASCSKQHYPTSPATPEATPSNTPIQTATPTQISATATETLVINQTPSHTNTITITTTHTATATITLTATMNITCYTPAIRDLLWGDTHQFGFNFYHDINGTIHAWVYTYFPGVQFKMAIFDGGNNKLAWNDSAVVSDANGYYGRDLMPMGSGNTQAAWHIAVIDAAKTIPASYSPSNPDFLDTQTVFVVSNAPTPVSTPPVMNMPIVCLNPNYTLESYNFRLDACSIIYYNCRWSTYGSTKICFYDGNNDLIYTEESASTYAGSGASNLATYKISGSETPGTWHIMIYLSSVIPPIKYSGTGGTIIEVE